MKKLFKSMIHLALTIQADEKETQSEISDSSNSKSKPFVSTLTGSPKSSAEDIINIMAINDKEISDNRIFANFITLV